MTQQVEFPAIPNTTPSDYQSVVKQLLGYVKRESPPDKELRRYMRARSIYDKATAPQLLELIGIEVKEAACGLTPIGQELYDLDDDVAWRKALFKSLANRNAILLKYVFDALAERLYSVNEMYRVLTSYVYPGIHVTLVNFKNWMGWIEATGMIKYIGIRWGPSPFLKEMEDFLRTIDIEEILEEESEGDYEDEEDDEEGDEDAPAGEVEGFEEEGLELPPEPDLPPMAAQAPPPTAPSVGVTPVGQSPKATPAGATAQGPASMPPMAAGEPIAPMAPYQVKLTLRSVAEIQEVQRILELDPGGADVAQSRASLDDAELASNLRGLQDLWGTAQGRTTLGFEAFGLNPDDYRAKTRRKGIKSFFLYRALAAATCAYRPARMTGTGRDPAPSGVNRYQVLEQSGALSRHFLEMQPIDDVVTAMVAAGHAGRLDILALTPFLVLARQALADADEWIKEVEKAASADQVWELIYGRLHAGVFTLELIWVVREMARHGLWTAEGLDATGVVPTQDVLDITFRVGMLPTPYVADFASTLYASRTLTGFCGKDYGYEAGLLHFGRSLGCAYDCPNRSVCTYFCREKLRR